MENEDWYRLAYVTNDEIPFALHKSQKVQMVGTDSSSVKEVTAGEAMPGWAIFPLGSRTLLGRLR